MQTFFTDKEKKNYLLSHDMKGSTTSQVLLIVLVINDVDTQAHDWNHCVLMKTTQSGYINNEQTTCEDCLVVFLPDFSFHMNNLGLNYI